MRLSLPGNLQCCGVAGGLTLPHIREAMFTCGGARRGGAPVGVGGLTLPRIREAMFTCGGARRGGGAPVGVGGLTLPRIREAMSICAGARSRGIHGASRSCRGPLRASEPADGVLRAQRARKRRGITSAPFARRLSGYMNYRHGSPGPPRASPTQSGRNNSAAPPRTGYPSSAPHPRWRGRSRRTALGP
jgi:hypothetical protein